MTDVKVMNRKAARRFSYGDHTSTYAVISINDTWDMPNSIVTNYPANGIKAVTHLFFDDVTEGDENCITKQDAQKIAQFVHQWKDKVDCIIVHCYAGISRSSGTAAAIAKYVLGDDSCIFDNPKYCPNMTCYKYVLAALTEYTVSTPNLSY